LVVNRKGVVASAGIRVAMIGQKGYPPVGGGIERHVAEIAHRLAARGFAVDVYSRPHYSQAAGDTEVPNLRVIRLPSFPTKHLDAFSHTLLASCDVLRRDTDVVHYHALGPGLLAWMPRWLARKRTVVTVHGLDWQREKWGPIARGVLKLGEAASCRLPDRTIVVSRALQAHFRKRWGVETTYIPNGIARPGPVAAQALRAAGLPEQFVLFAARIVPEKGLHLLLSAHRCLPGELRRAYPLVVAGDEGFTHEYAESLRGQAHPEVRFLGFVHGPLLEALFAHASVMVLPSTLEGLSIALLEAMAHGRCCLVSDIPPNVEAAGGCCAVFPSGSAEGLRAQLEGLLLDAPKRTGLGERARARVLANYSWDAVADQTAAVYRGLCKNGVSAG
jgi:glycosyltransferase involved in cell wall biosynthesis